MTPEPLPAVSTRDARSAVVVGMLGLAAAMGIGRFAFTPLLPLMQSDGLSLAHGAWLAAANYLGYLAGALGCVWLRVSAGAMARAGLLAVALLTLAMGLTSAFASWLAWRLLAGAASALVLVGVAAWSLPLLAQAGHPAWAGRVFAGVGVGIALAGLVGLGAGILGQPPGHAWIGLGIVATAVTLLAWRPLSVPGSIAGVGPAPPARAIDAAGWRLIACYGATGFGYILPATFLPAAARELLADPALYGWCWPLFGLAAAVSTAAASSLLRGLDARRLWAGAQWVMALGVAAPALSRSIAALLFSALCVGGTFMVLTMAAMQVGREVGGAGAPRLIAAMTAAFATGQLLGPLTVGAAASGGVPGGPSLFAAGLLAVATLLLRGRAPGASTMHAERTS
jgi:hypothetical protein